MNQTTYAETQQDFALPSAMADFDILCSQEPSIVLPRISTEYDLSTITELGMAKAVHDTFSSSVHVLDETKSGLWRRDIGGETVSSWFIQYLECGRKAAAKMILARDSSAPKLLTALQKLERNNAVQGAKEFLKSMEGITVTQAIFDTDPYIAGLRDGMCIDLRTGAARKIIPADCITKTLGTH